jgi:cell division protein FtsB
MIDTILLLVLIGLVIYFGRKTLAKVDELKAELVEANATTNEIATDVDDLVARLSGGLSEAEADDVKAELVALKGRLQAVAAVHTP